ncbi:MAG: acetaldehyde dehydrogenase (acetylating) [Firmicutes bacterium]|jgi:acetaldehyde dehydrogenase (acetylating)|nr:acetaldehyde dehydrogenase (acetylating) [Bacillota bacterium]NBI62992.1 acetaldehyde dehydrogenase (acetylating) [Clostridiales bacterium]
MENMDYDLRAIQEVRNLARLGQIATEQIANYNEEQIDKIVRNMVRVAEANEVSLAQMAVEETGFGKVEDKAYKNHMASTLLYQAIKDMKTIGIIGEDPVARTMDVADPVGLLMGIVPSTNPTSTAIFKSIIAIKARNAIIFSPHPSAAKCTQKAARLMYEAAVEAGAPANIIGCISMPSVQATDELMHCKEVKMIIATGGPGMVKAAYSAGKPALGVGAGNSPAYIERTANVQQAITNIMASKTFDYGTICASEQSIICEECNKDAVIAELKRQGGYFMTPEETDKVCKLLFKNGHAMNAKFVGRSPFRIATAAGITIPENTKVLIGPQGGVGEGYPLSYEKLTSVLAFYVVKDWHEACELSIDLLQNGIGHTMSLHTEDRNVVLEFTRKPASRILVNTGSSMGGTGASTGLLPSFTLGCGTWGGSSVSENVSPLHLVNIKKVAYGTKNCATLAADDPTFHHPEFASADSASCMAVPSCGTPVSPVPAAAPCCGTPVSPAPAVVPSCGSTAGYLSPAEYQNNNSGISYSTGCNSCTDNSQAPVASDQPINTAQLTDMINTLVKAMRGE